MISLIYQWADLLSLGICLNQVVMVLLYCDVIFCKIVSFALMKC